MTPEEKELYWLIYITCGATIAIVLWRLLNLGG